MTSGPVSPPTDQRDEPTKQKEMTSIHDELIDLCDTAIAALPSGTARDSVTAVRRNLDQPLQVTVAGGVSSGKSTLVNALLGQKIAAVDAGECTRVVTRFTYDHHERAEVILHDGTARTLTLTDGVLPTELGVPIESVDEVVVHLSNRGLEHLSIIDTPGLDTVTTENQERTEAFLGLGATGSAGHATASAIGRADALVFLMPHLRESDARILHGFRDLYSGTGLSAFNAVAVLSKIDQLTREGDPMAAARPIADRVRSEARALVSAVLPVVGLLAETAACARLSEEHARALRALATFGDDLDREDLLMTPEAFLTHDGADVPVTMRQQLFERLGLYGLTVALGAIDAGRTGAVALHRVLDERSGLDPLRHRVIEQLGARSRLLKCHSALCDLRRISYTRTADPDEQITLHRLQSPLDRFEFDPTLHDLRVAETLQDAANGTFRLPDQLMADLERLGSNADPIVRVGADGSSGVAPAALAAASRWGRFANDPRRRPSDAQRARTVKTAYEMIWQAASAGATTR